MNAIKNGLVTQTMTETVSGIFIDLADPSPDDINIYDIAWALSRQSRYAGHTMCRIPYTVAQHTVVVSKYVEEALTQGTHLNAVFLEYIAKQVQNAGPSDKLKWMEWEDTTKTIDAERARMHTFHGLMHDFAEAYLVDLPTPVKRLPGVYEAYKAHELRMDALIYETFGLSYSEKQQSVCWEYGKMIVTWADMYALLVEAYHFMPSRGVNWGIPLERPSLSVLYGFRWPMPNVEAYEDLLIRFDELKPKIHDS